MGIANATLMDGATALSVTGGSSKSYTPDGETVPNGIQLTDVSVSDFRLRRQIVVRTKLPKRQPNGTYSKAKRYITIREPFLASDGVTVLINTYRYESDVCVETSAASEANLRKVFAQCLFDPDFDSFHLYGSLA